jgi:hypothetical protein
VELWGLSQSVEADMMKYSRLATYIQQKRVQFGRSESMMPADSVFGEGPFLGS